MQKAKKIRKLTLGRETLRQLEPNEAKAAGGAILTTNYISCVGNCHTYFC